MMKNIWLIALISIVFGTVSCSKKDKDEDKTNFTVIFDAAGGNPIPETQTVEADGTVTAPAANPAKSGYVFMSWCLNGTETAYNFNTPVTNNITLYAKWKEEAKVEYWQVTWELNGGAWPSSGDNHATQAVKDGTLSEPDAPVKSGNTFDGWYKEAALTTKIDFPYDVSALTADFTLYAKWTTGDTPEDDTPPTALYVVGRNNYGACCWRVDLATNEITQIALNAYGEANGIVISNGDMYISGYRTNTNAKSQACYWKNGIVTFLTDSGKDFEGVGIAVSVNDIYVAGEEYGTGGKNCYWKNGVQTNLPSAQSAGVKDIFVSGNDVYVCGWEGGVSGKEGTACYWKNSVKTTLTDGQNNAETRAVFVSGTDIYVAGRERKPYSTTWIARYWKNGSPVTLTDGNNDADVNSITVSNDKVYAAGYENPGVSIACYWENGNRIVLEQSTLAKAYDIAVSGKNVYAAGCTWIDTGSGNGHYQAGYWNNGVRTDLTDGKKESEAFAIALSWE